MNLFHPTDFMPHGMCYLWRPDILWLHVLSDAGIALAYFTIAGTLWWFVSKRSDLPFRTIFWMFALFIVSCGVTHLYGIWVVWHPDYVPEGLVKLFTATVSLATAVALVPLLPKALALRSPRELEALNTELAQTLAQLNTVVHRYEHEKYIAESFQNASLSDVPREIDGMKLSAVYHPGSGDLEIGGDWYDCFVLLDGRILISIGDVTGSGLAASIIMSKIRQAIRVAALIQIDPARILDSASRTQEIEFPDTIVTAFVGIIDPSEDTLSYANAGHVRPIVRHVDGRIEELEGASLPLGLRRRGEEQSQSWKLRAGALVLLYTDGLVESTHDYAIGAARLRGALDALDLTAESNPARAIFDAVLHDGVRDDVAILTLQLASAASAAYESWDLDASDRERAGDVRQSILERLERRGASAQAIFNAAMVYSELLGNAYRYAPGRVHVRLDWRGELLVLHVRDEGPGFDFLPELPDDVMSERGRGLFIVNALAEDFHIKAGPHGGSHARAVLRGSTRNDLPASGRPPAAKGAA